MGKRKTRSKRSIQNLPKGLPVKGKRSATNGDTNPFEVTQRSKRPKFQVANRTTTVSARSSSTSALAQALEKRKTLLRASLRQQKKTNVFSDKRLGEHEATMTASDQNLARLVRERTRRSKKSARFSLNDTDNDSNHEPLTHRGKTIDALTAADHVMLSDDEEDTGNLDAFDTAMHFGGNRSDQREANIYGGGGAGGANSDMQSQYAQKKTDLDELILRRKVNKAERLQARETQLETFEEMDKSFAELANMLQFRDKEKDIKEYVINKRAGTLSKEDAEFAEWDKEMKQYLYVDRKVKAADRTKTPEEIAKLEAERLHDLETRRLARMNGDFEDDDFSDLDELSDDDDVTKDRNHKKRRSAHRKSNGATAEALDNPSDDENNNESSNKLSTRMTEDGLVYINKNGEIVPDPNSKSGVALKSADAETEDVEFAIGQKVTASFRAKEQYDGKESWYTGTIAGIDTDDDGNGLSYTIEYDDGDVEDGVEPRHVRPSDESSSVVDEEITKSVDESEVKMKQQKAKEKARSEIPFVFEVPTTLEALHDMIGTYATTGADASLIIQRIHKANSVRLDRRNKEKMQNFYDVLIRRFIAVGDAIHASGNGGEELGRYAQLDALTQTLYILAQESPEIAGAVWSRRLGIFQNAHAKRLRDAALEQAGDEPFTAWPSVGVFLAFRAIGHIFPVTDKRHTITTPTLLFLGQVLSSTPILSRQDLVMGLMCCALLLEYTKEAKRLVPEAHAFLAGVVRLFTDSSISGFYRLPTFEAASFQDQLSTLRVDVAKCETTAPLTQLSLEAEDVNSDGTPAAILYTVLHLIEKTVVGLSGSLNSAEKEAFSDITESILALEPKSKKDAFPESIRSKISSVASTLSSCLAQQSSRKPVQRRSGPSIQESAIKSLAPRLENPDRYRMSKDKGKTAPQAAADRARREYKREHKAVARELRLDNAFIEGERRSEQHQKDTAQKQKRQKAFAWMEGEQAVMNQQVRQGGGLLQGGGMGAAKAKARSGKFGIKKGGKL